MKRNVLIVLSLILVLLVPLKVIATDIYVDPNWKNGYKDTVYGVTGKDGKLVVDESDLAEYEKKLASQNNKVVKDYISVIVKEKEITFKDAVPKIINNRVLVPMRSVFESEKVQCPVMWFSDTRQVVVFTPESECIVFTVDLDKYQVIKADGTTIERYLDSPAVIIDSRVYLPLRDVFEYMGYKVEWISSTKTVEITEKTHDSSSFEPEDSWKEYLYSWYKSQKGGCVECVVKNYLK